MNAFRGDDWMMEPCRSCARKEIDFGGCRCQAFMLAGNAAEADPICRLSPHHGIVESMRKDSDADVRADLSRREDQPRIQQHPFALTIDERGSSLMLNVTSRDRHQRIGAPAQESSARSEDRCPAVQAEDPIAAAFPTSERSARAE